MNSETGSNFYVPVAPINSIMEPVDDIKRVGFVRRFVSRIIKMVRR